MRASNGQDQRHRTCNGRATRLNYLERLRLKCRRCRERNRRTKWLLAVSGFVLVLALSVALLGWLLPVQHHATRQAHFHQPPGSLYAVLAGPPDWRSDVKASGPLPDHDGRKQWWEEDSHGQRVTFELLEDSPPSRRVVKIADRRLPFGGTWSYEIAPAPGGSDLRITEDGEVYNVIFRFMSRYIFGYTGSIERFFRDLGKKFGESPQTEA
jgi:hypothetical protein